MVKVRRGSSRPCQRHVCGSAFVDRCIVGAVLAGKARLLYLRLRRLNVGLAGITPLLRCRLRGNAIRTTVEAGAIVHDRRVVDVGVVHIGVVNHSRVHIHHRGVVGKHSAAPLAAAESHTAISETVIHAAVEADMVAPVAAMPLIHTAITPSPVSRRPQQPRLRSNHPCSGNPEISAVSVVCPVSRRPDVVRFRANRLNIYGQRRRLDGNRDSNSY